MRIIEQKGDVSSPKILLGSAKKALINIQDRRTEFKKPLDIYFEGKIEPALYTKIKEKFKPLKKAINYVVGKIYLFLLYLLHKLTKGGPSIS